MTLLEQKLECLRKVVQNRNKWKDTIIPKMNCKQKRKYNRAFVRFQKKRDEIEALNSSML